ncbi:MAG: hypothetical protein J6B09_07770 [Clostridia bacterium]|nr:hypothetical protein [Clostridia bacterium]
MPEEQSTHREEPEGLPEEEFSRLMQSVSAMAPLLKGFFPPKSEPKHIEHGKDEAHRDAPFHFGKAPCPRREALLLALKPYLSPERCAAVDYLIRLARVGDAIRAMQ